MFEIKVDLENFGRYSVIYMFFKMLTIDFMHDTDLRFFLHNERVFGTLLSRW